MGNKNTTIYASTTVVQPSPRCLNRECKYNAFPGFILCLDHIKEAKRIQMEIDEGRTKKN